MTIERRVTVVSGAASGMGRAVADLLRARGERVVGIDRAGGDVVADLSCADGRASAAAEVGRLCPDGIDAIIACAGVAISDGPLVVSVNFFGAIGLIEGLGGLLRIDRAPRAVAVSSAASILPVDPQLLKACLAGEEKTARELALDNPLAYNSSKLALSHWIRRTSILPAWAPAGVLLNAVAPGQVLTPMIEPRLATEEGRAVLSSRAPFVTPDRAKPGDIALLLAFLAGPDNRCMVGQVVFCDGGMDVLLRDAAGHSY